MESLGTYTQIHTCRPTTPIFIFPAFCRSFLAEKIGWRKFPEGREFWIPLEEALTGEGCAYARLSAWIFALSVPTLKITPSSQFLLLASGTTGTHSRAFPPQCTLLPGNPPVRCGVWLQLLHMDVIWRNPEAEYSRDLTGGGGNGDLA